MKVIHLVMLTICLLLAGCDHIVRTTVSTVEEELGPPPVELIDTRWHLIAYQVGDETLGFGHWPESIRPGPITFQQGGEFWASDGCNSVMGEYGSSVHQELAFGTIMSTVVSCGTVRRVLENGELGDPVQIPMDETEWFRNALRSVFDYELDDDVLKLYFANTNFRSSGTYSTVFGKLITRTQYMEFEAQPLVIAEQPEAHGKSWQGIPASRECVTTQAATFATEQDC